MFKLPLYTNDNRIRTLRFIVVQRIEALCITFHIQAVVATNDNTPSQRELYFLQHLKAQHFLLDASFSFPNVLVIPSVAIAADATCEIFTTP